MNDFLVTFWGVRGSRPVPGAHTLRYGGNTPCVQVQIGDRLIILDAGTGICNLGQAITDQGVHPVCGDLLITHAHWDHIQGFPFFAPAFQEGNFFRLYGSGVMNQAFHNLMRGQMINPHFPVQFEDLAATIDFCEVGGGDRIDLGDGITVRTILNNHPNGGLSFRIEHSGRVCCYLTDLEHEEGMSPELIRFAEDADLLIYDANYTEREYRGWDGLPPRIGWGHSTWQAGVELARQAQVGRLVLFHHDLNRHDDELAEIEREAAALFPQTLAAQEGLVIRL